MRLWVVLLFALFLAGCRTPQMEQKEAEKFLNDYSKKYQDLYYASSKAEWASNTHIVEGDSGNAIATRQAEEALAGYTGSEENIKTIRKFLAGKDNFTPLEIKQLERMLYLAADNPQTVSDLVKERIKVQTEEVEKIYGFDYKIDGKSVSTNDIDEILDNQTNLKTRLQAWRESKEVGKTLRTGLIDLQKLRNQSVQALGYPDYFSYQVSDYGMTTPEMMALNQQFIREVWPLYRELHTYARYELARKYGVSKVPDYLPAQWLPNRWGQDWNAMVTIKGMDLDAVLKKKTAVWVMHQGERFYLSLGFPALPASFWEKSSLYPLPPDSGYKKNNHASAWHMNLGTDVRCLMSVISNAEWYETVHHELGHIYYFISYTNPDVPILLREGANRAFHEALGSLMGLASMQKPFLAHLDILPSDVKTDETKALLKEALNYIVPKFLK